MMEEISEETWAAWSRLLTPSAKLRLAATRSSRTSAAARHYSSVSLSSSSSDDGSADADQVVALYSLATELRDRLRFSQNRITNLQQDLKAVQQKAASDVQAVQAHAAHLLQQADGEREYERQQAEIRLSAFNSELARLSKGVVGQAAAQEVHQDQVAQLQSKLAAAQAEVVRLKQSDAEHVNQRRSMLQEVQSLQAQLSEAKIDLAEGLKRAESAEHKQKQLAEALMQAKDTACHVSQVERLYQAARDELARLDKENAELKDMLDKDGLQLTMSRILETCSPGRGRSLSPGRGRRPMSPGRSLPLHMAPEIQNKKVSATTGHRAPPGTVWSTPPRVHVSRDVMFEYEQGELLLREGRSGSPPAKHPLRKESGKSSGCGADEIGQMAWLGAPSSAYPEDPDMYEYVRAGGGFMPRYAGKKSSPKASGWVPKDIVRIVQAFRHAYNIKSPEWYCWEPLLLMVDEVYRARGSPALQVKSKADGGQAADVSYPGVLQSARIAYLKSQLHGMQQKQVNKQANDVGTLRRMAQKEYHLINQLDEAVDQNVELRQALQELRNLHPASPQA